MFVMTLEGGEEFELASIFKTFVPSADMLQVAQHPQVPI
jgi:hypothetical protein